MSVWAGGLGAILLLRARGPLTDSSSVIVRFSHLALLAWCVLALSGLWALLTRLGSPIDLVTTAFGLVGLAKIMLLLALGVLGALQRRRLAVRTGADGPGRPFLRLAGIELVLMAAAVVLGALLALLPVPGGAAATGPAADLTGHALPPAPSAASLLASWRPDALVIALALTLVWALRFPRTGPRAAPRARSAELRVVVGAVLLVLVVCGPLGVYGPVLSSAHLLQQGLLLVLVGPLLAGAVPTPGGLSRLLHRDPWTAPLLALGPTGLLALVHATPWLLGPALATIPGHELLLLAPVVLGALTWWTVEPGADARRDGDSGADPTLPAGPSARLRVWRTVLAALPVAGLAASGLALALGSTLLASDRFGATGRTWRADALADQQTGGWILVGLAVLAGIALVGIALAGRAIASRTTRRGARARE
nr:CopD family protein [Brachybacterium sp. ACRRE]